MVLSCKLLSPFFAAAITISVIISMFLSANSLGSISTIADVVPGVRFVGNFAIEFKTAVRPFISLPYIGEAL